MDKLTLVKTITNRYGTFCHYRSIKPMTFDDYVRIKLSRGKIKDRTIISKNVVKWTPKEGGPTHQISLGVLGEMIALVEKPLEAAIGDSLHALMVAEIQ